MGRSAFFIRLAGCPLHCPWCDSAGTWSRDAVPAAKKMTEEELAALAVSSHADFVVITGGEPTIHDLVPLTTALRARALRIHLETCGAFPIVPAFDWVTLSPKRKKLPLAENWAKADELKFIITDADELAFWEHCFNAAALAQPFPQCWLHPEWSRAGDPALLALIADFVRSRGFPWRAGWQIHKLYNAR